MSKGLHQSKSQTTQSVGRASYLYKERASEEPYNRVLVVICTIPPEEERIVLGDNSVGGVVALNPLTDAARADKKGTPCGLQ